MPGAARLASEEARSTARDPAAKILALLDFSAGRGGDEALEDTLSVLLFSLMGEFAAPSAAALLEDGEGGLRVSAAKGRGANALLHRAVAASASAFDATAIQATELAPKSPLAELAADSGLDLLVKIGHQTRTLGLLALGSRATGARWSPEEIQLVELVGRIAGTVVANHLLWAEVQSVNRQLQRRVLDLHALFDVSVELARAGEPDDILRMFGQTAMAHVLVSRCVILLAEERRLKVAFERGLSLGAADRQEIEESTGVDDDHADTLARLEAVLARTGIQRLVPFRSGSATRGFIGLGAKRSGGDLTNADIELLSTLGNQAMTALDNLKFHIDRARREQLERELGLARDIQVGLFPRTLPALAGYRLHAHTEPCHEVGGDYYDALALDGGLLIAVGDVSGKGVPAALLMSTLQATVRSLGRQPGASAAGLVRCLNHNLVESVRPGKFATFFLARLDASNHRLSYCNGGHNWPFLLRASGALERLRTGGPLLGVLPDAEFEQGEVELEPGDLLFAFTDGVSEAMDPDETEFGEGRLEALLLELRRLPPSQIVSRVLEEVRRHAGLAEPSDDLTILALAREPRGNG